MGEQKEITYQERTRRLSKEMSDKVREEYLEGRETQREIAARHGYTLSDVKAVTKGLGELKKARQEELEYEEIDKRAKEEGVKILSRTKVKKGGNQVIELELSCEKHGLQVKKSDPKRSKYLCPECGRESIPNTRRLPFEEVLATYEAKGYKLLSTEEDYVNVDTPLRCICPKHGEIEITPHSLRDGSECRECAYEKMRLTNLKVKEEAESKGLKYVRGLKREVLEQGVNSWDETITVECSIHGLIDTTYASLKSSTLGCTKCSSLEQTFVYSKKQADVNRKEWAKELCTVYVVLFESKIERFIKVGVCSGPLRTRFGSKSSRGGYKITEKYKRRMSLYDGVVLEQEILKMYKNAIYVPKHKFEGYTECLEEKVLCGIVERIEQKDVVDIENIQGDKIKLYKKLRDSKLSKYKIAVKLDMSIPRINYIDEYLKEQNQL